MKDTGVSGGALISELLTRVELGRRIPDMASPLELLAEDVEWHQRSGPRAGVYRGPHSVVDYLANLPSIVASTRTSDDGCEKGSCRGWTDDDFGSLVIRTREGKISYVRSDVM